MGIMARKREQSEQSEEAARSLVMVMTVSLFIILLAFFIMLNAIAVVDSSRQRVALGSLMENFGVLSGGYSLLKGNSQKVSSEKINKISNLLDFSDLIKKNKNPLMNLMVTSNLRQSVIRIPDALVFQPASATIKPSSHKLLDRICKVIRETQYPAEIAGYMDRDRDELSPGVTLRELSALRALAVLRYFVGPGKVSPDLVTAYGWGSAQPLMSNKVPEGRIANRRLEITIAHRKKREKPTGFFTFKNFFFNMSDQ